MAKDVRPRLSKVRGDAAGCHTTKQSRNYCCFVHTIFVVVVVTSCERFQQHEQDPTNLYIANLPPNFTDATLRMMLDPFGLVISTRILSNNDGSSRCVGFARLTNKEACERAIEVSRARRLAARTIAASFLVLQQSFARQRAFDRKARRQRHTTAEAFDEPTIV